MIRSLLVAAFLSVSAVAHAQAPNAAQQQADAAALQAVTGKMNAYVALMNRTMRASESIARYKSWVDMDKGPVNTNRAFGLYQLYDVTKLVADASKALNTEPKLADLDASMKAYIEAYSQLAPIVDEANTYYERKDYLDDNLARGKQIHTRLVPAAAAFLAAREKVEQAFQVEQTKLAQKELAAIEQSEGRKANWHRTNLMLAAQRIIDRMPSNEAPVVDVAAFEANVSLFATASKDFDDYRKSDPEALKSLEGPVQSFLAASREFRDAIKPVKGDVRRGGGQKLQSVVNAYNALVGTANNLAN
ncbi:YiiG family protein [Microvirga sp. ACRRW]|uniref:DUF3829 domain-containing protein n=1 Tax=Microvirga sp. ACRRW TaxID=2918205 RepID=UPI001EF4E16F|nr:DUF3829 domain-containing protein [Microvirga sp. ACRRW]MCG7394641.1 YiiG family protein [Microvirga sp. ACRRW]